MLHVHVFTHSQKSTKRYGSYIFQPLLRLTTEATVPWLCCGAVLCDSIGTTDGMTEERKQQKITEAEEDAEKQAKENAKEKKKTKKTN